MTWTQHNNLDLNLDTSVCQLKHNAAFCLTLKHKHDHKTRSQPRDRNTPLNHRRKHHLHPPFHHGKMVNDIKMTSVQQHWIPIPTIKCPNCMAALTFWVSSSFNTWPLKSWLSYCGGKHKCIQKSIVWYLKRRSKVPLWKEEMLQPADQLKVQELISLWYFYHRHKSSEHLLKIPASWGLNSIKPQDMLWFWEREICPRSALLSTSKYPQFLVFTSL